MIRLIQRNLIIPRGDTGSFSIPVLGQKNTGDVAVFTIFNSLTRTKIFQKEIAAEGDTINIAFSHNETVNLTPGRYLWDIKFYKNPQYADGVLINGDEVDSYYAGYSLPTCEIRPTGDHLLVSDDAPTTTLNSQALNTLNAILSEVNTARNDAATAAQNAASQAEAAATSVGASRELINQAEEMIENATAIMADTEFIIDGCDLQAEMTTGFDLVNKWTFNKNTMHMTSEPVGNSNGRSPFLPVDISNFPNGAEINVRSMMQSTNGIYFTDDDYNVIEYYNSEKLPPENTGINNDAVYYKVAKPAGATKVFFYVHVRNINGTHAQQYTPADFTVYYKVEGLTT